MNYKEFKKVYNYMVKHYPDTTTFYNGDNFNTYIIGDVVIENYTKSGSKWILKDTTTENITSEYYCNVVDAIPFFKNLGGYEGITTNYTKYGLIPVTINSISPDKQSKTIRRFKFN